MFLLDRFPGVDKTVIGFYFRKKLKQRFSHQFASGPANKLSAFPVNVLKPPLLVVNNISVRHVVEQLLNIVSNSW
jgi:hypothetical protein